MALLQRTGIGCSVCLCLSRGETKPLEGGVTMAKKKKRYGKKGRKRKLKMTKSAVAARRRYRKNKKRYGKR